MRTLWEYELPAEGQISDFHCESPILLHNGYVFYISVSSGCPKLLHIIDMDSGAGRTELLRSVNVCLPSDYFFIEYKEQVIIYADDLFLYRQGDLIRVMELAEKGKVTAHLLNGNRLILSCSKQQNVVLCCCDLDTFSVEWKRDITNLNPYQAGELSAYENLIACYGACYGKSQLMFLEYDTGKTADSVTLPRIDKLFWPLKADDGNMLIGYTNWTNAGILKYDLLNRKIVWRHKRKFQGPQLDCKIYRHNDMVFWVKNNTELISLDMDTGAEIYSLRTTPWLYTDLRFLQDDLIYGTSGADGYINCIDARSGNVRWSVFLKNGCAYYDICGESVIVGDFNKTLKQISYSDGVILQDYRTDGEVVGRIKVSEGCIYTVIWGNSKKGVRVVKVLI